MQSTQVKDTNKKKWGKFLLEFFMLFLAVFLGSIAENIRESFVEKKKEKEYIQSMIKDLKSDTSKLNEVIAGYQLQIARQDTLLLSFPSLKDGINAKFYRNFVGVQGFPDFISTDATIQQLKNSGGFGILKNRKDIDSIMVYDFIVKKGVQDESILRRNYMTLEDLSNETFDFVNLIKILQTGKTIEKLESEKYDFLLTHEKKELSKFYNNLYSFWKLNYFILYEMNQIKNGATRLIVYLEREYDLKNN